jgi:hypothetical protein
VRILLGIAAALLVLAAAPAIAQERPHERFDLRDWTRKALPDSPTALFECRLPKNCGANSVVSGRLIERPKEPLTVEGQKARQQEIVRRMREQGAGRIKDIEVDETKETKIEGLQFVYTEKRVIPEKGPTRVFLDGILVGKTKAYTVVSSGLEPAQVRSNFNGMAVVAALILDQMALEAATSAASPTPSSSPTPPANPTPQ